MSEYKILYIHQGGLFHPDECGGSFFFEVFFEKIKAPGFVGLRSDSMLLTRCCSRVKTRRKHALDFVLQSSDYETKTCA